MNFQLNSETAHFIVLQRTQYQSKLSKFFWKTRLRPWYERYCLRWIEGLRKDQISALYLQDLEHDFETFRSSLPHTVHKVLDVGAGIAGIDLVLYEDCLQQSGHPVELHLLDVEDAPSPSEYGYSPTKHPHNSLRATREFLLAHQVSEKNIYTYDAWKVGFPKNIKFDVVLSFLSWGFHYSIQTYLSDVLQSLQPHGVLILDVRNSSDGEEELRKVFSKVEALKKSEKFTRFCCSEQK